MLCALAKGVERLEIELSVEAFFEIPDDARRFLAGLKSKAEWYAALGRHYPAPQLKDAPSLNAQDELPGWIWALRNEPPPLGLMFKGDFCTSPDGTGDPEMVFLGRELVRGLSDCLAQTDDARFRDLLPPYSPPANNSKRLWFLNPLRDFFRAAASRGMQSLLCTATDRHVDTIFKRVFG